MFSDMIFEIKLLVYGYVFGDADYKQLYHRWKCRFIC